MKTRLILASQSPRRKELLERLGYEFESIASSIDETIDTNNKLEDEIINLAYKKAKSIFDNNKDSIVIGADTIVVIDNKILGKPKDDKDAYEMLKKLSNNKHEVITGMCVITPNGIVKKVNISYVYFNELSDKEIYNYIATKEPMDKAGAYGIQGKAACFINRIDGDYYSIMGLSISDLYNILKDLNKDFDFNASIV